MKMKDMLLSLTILSLAWSLGLAESLRGGSYDVFDVNDLILTSAESGREDTTFSSTPGMFVGDNKRDVIIPDRSTQEVDVGETRRREQGVVPPSPVPVAAPRTTPVLVVVPIVCPKTNKKKYCPAGCVFNKKKEKCQAQVTGPPTPGPVPPDPTPGPVAAPTPVPVALIVCPKTDKKKYCHSGCIFNEKKKKCQAPVAAPTTEPVAPPTNAPAAVPRTLGPSSGPSSGPTGEPTGNPTSGPTGVPTSRPTSGPSVGPTTGSRSPTWCWW